MRMNHDYAEVNGVRLHCASAGEGPLMVFLHGFPQCWYMWRHQLPEFARDHLVVAPDLRGYNLSSKPERLSEYGPWQAAEDVRALVDLLGYDRFVLVGHDWGVATAWSFALHYPERLGPPDPDGTPARGNYAPEVAPLRVEVPTLVVYPEDDIYTRPPAHEGVDRYVSDLTFRTIEGGSHWIAEDRPDIVNEHIREFLRARAVAFAASG